MKILITGATGLIGKKLVHKLVVEGHEVLALARSTNKLPELPEKNIFSWSDKNLPPKAALENCDAVIHLAGEGIADQRWSAERKKKLWNSRVSGTKNLVDGIAALTPEQRPKIFISGSAIGYYKNGDQAQDESSNVGQGFLSDLCLQWENSALQAEKLGVRTVLLRTGLVLAKEGGVLSKSGPVVLGDGQQWMSWIHIEDMVNFILFTIQSKTLSGPYNLVAPNPVTNIEFTKSVAKISGYPFTISAPTIALKLALGEMSDAILASQKILPQKTLSAGFKFKFEYLQNALENLIGGRSLTDNSFSTKQFIPLNRKDVFQFFGDAKNLETLTPPWLNFHIVKKSTAVIEKDCLIDYKLNIHGIPVKWRTLISEWTPEESFVDDQLKGPYKKWHHVHTFEDVPGGTLISDDVTFQIPGWIFGKILLPFVNKDVHSIFKYRQEKIKELCQSGMLK